MEKVRAKFKVVTKERTVGEESCKTVYLHPVTSGSLENESFYKYTPAGSIVLSTINSQAAEYFAVGREYYIDFIEVPD